VLFWLAVRDVGKYLFTTVDFSTSIILQDGLAGRTSSLHFSGGIRARRDGEGADVGAVSVLIIDRMGWNGEGSIEWDLVGSGGKVDLQCLMHGDLFLCGYG
jgi:hypothetical protein